MILLSFLFWILFFILFTIFVAKWLQAYILKKIQRNTGFQISEATYFNHYISLLE